MRFRTVLVLAAVSVIAQSLSIGQIRSGPETHEVFRIVEVPDEYVDIEIGNRKVVRFVHKPRDGSSPDLHYMTYKPFHQVFDPDTGTIQLSSGVHAKTEKAEFPHHRGFFFGFNRITYGDQKADNWHCTDNVYMTCEQIIDQIADKSQASYTAVIGWYGSDGKKFAEEYRSIAVSQYKWLKAGSLVTQIDWSTKLVPLVEQIKLDGDPQHAGFHFRANQEVALKSSKQTYFLRPDGKGEQGETRNWDPKSKDPRTINLPWNAMSFMVGGERYTVLRINHPDNPRETRGSERDYGRFGDYFEYEATPEKPLKLKYRLVVQKGELDVDYCERIAQQFLPVDKND